jgi:hypothetical protein
LHGSYESFRWKVSSRRWPIRTEDPCRATTRSAGDVPITFGDVSEVKEKLGYSPSVDMEEGVLPRRSARQKNDERREKWILKRQSSRT